MGNLSFLEYEALRDRALRWGREIATDIKQHVTSEVERIIKMALEESTDRIVAASHAEFQQLANLLGSLATKDATIEELRAELAAAATKAQASADRLDAASTELESDDPAPEPAPEEPPVEPTP